MFDNYIEQYGRRLCGLCYRLCASQQEAQDLYQETWLRALANFRRYDPEREFEPWISRICVNCYRNQLKKKKYLFTYEHPEDEIAPEKEGHGALYDAINKLPEKLRATIILFYFRDMDISSTAKALGIPEGTVKSRLNKGRKLLKEVLTNEEYL